MASRFLSTSLRSAARPPVAFSARSMATEVSTPKVERKQVTPEEKAAELVAAFPETSFASKTGLVLTGAGLMAAGISQEFFVFNHESIIAFSSLLAFYGIGKLAGPPFVKWLEDKSAIKHKILVDARQGHYDGFAKQIDEISLLSDSVQATKDMYALSRQTAQYEAENFVLKQENAMNAEAKSVLDSWVRHEQQVRESEQAQLVKTIQTNVLKSINDPKFKKDLIASALTDIEKLVNAKQV